jgi:AcrR family transcriptional regulator
MSMSISYERTGRQNQKARTRAALVEAARRLIADGGTPTVEGAAEAASISRATAYRYFPTQHELLVSAHPEVEVVSMLGPDPPSDPAERLDRVVVGLADMFLSAEESYRTMLRLSLEPDATDRGELTLRKGRRYLWIEDALEPIRVRLGAENFQRLVHAVSTVVGIEALVTLVDLARLDRRRAVEVMRWAARALVSAALVEESLDERPMAGVRRR